MVAYNPIIAASGVTSLRYRDYPILNFITDASSARSIILLLKVRYPNLQYIILNGELWYQISKEIGNDHHPLLIEGVEILVTHDISWNPPAFTIDITDSNDLEQFPIIAFITDETSARAVIKLLKKLILHWPAFAFHSLFGVNWSVTMSPLSRTMSTELRCGKCHMIILYNLILN